MNVEYYFQPKYLVPTLLNSSTTFLLQTFAVFSNFTHVSLQHWNNDILYNFQLIYYKHVLLNLDVMTYDIDYNIYV